MKKHKLDRLLEAAKMYRLNPQAANLMEDHYTLEPSVAPMRNDYEKKAAILYAAYHLIGWRPGSGTMVTYWPDITIEGDEVVAPDDHTAAMFNDLIQYVDNLKNPRTGLPRGRDGGRPPIGDEPMERHNITIDKSLWQKAEQIGDGVASDGIRKALEAWQ